MVQMKTKEFILQQVQKKRKISSAEIVSALGISRQTAAQHLRELANQKKLLKIGSTRGSFYQPYSKAKVRSLTRAKTFSGVRSVKNLQEDRVFREADLRMNLKRALSKGAHEIINYAFTEMLNNVIDHSKSKQVFFAIKVAEGKVYFNIQDHGIGVFESIRKKFHLGDHYEAVEHLLKGKQTTAPKKHSGEGIFFTSKISDRFSLESARLKLIVDNEREDTALVQRKRFMMGTEVQFMIKQRSAKRLKPLFDLYSNEEYEFDKTRVVVHLSKKEGEYISRSEAKRILIGLEKFKRILFDFKQVPAVGQSFADEIFRVYQKEHPETQFEIANAVPAVALMINRARSKTLQL